MQDDARDATANLVRPRASRTGSQHIVEAQMLKDDGDELSRKLLQRGRH
jgi:hypothetical protein